MSDEPDAIEEMDKAIGALRYEVSDIVWEDVRRRYDPVRALVFGERGLADQLAAALEELVYVMDPPEGCWPQDMSTCAYYRRGLPDADPNGQCSFGCSQEPECQTMHPTEGWPLERARAALARFHETQESAPFERELPPSQGGYDRP